MKKKTVVDEEKQRVILCLTESFSAFLHLYLFFFFFCVNLAIFTVFTLCRKSN